MKRVYFFIVFFIFVMGIVGTGNEKALAVSSPTYGDYFEVTVDNLPVYDNSSGQLVKMGSLTMGQEYPRISDYGDWHKIRFGNKYGYVPKSGTSPTDGSEIKNKNSGYSQSQVFFKSLVDLPVYDNSSGHLVQFATIKDGQYYPIVSDYGEYGDWYRVLVSGRVGFVRKSQVIRITFTPDDKYFEVTQDNLPIYDNRTGILVKVGTLKKGQVYPRVSDYGTNWHEIKFGNINGYVYKPDTLPSDGDSLKNLNTSYPNSDTTFETLNTTKVYDNTSGLLVPFATIDKGKVYPIISDYGNWYRIDVSGRIGYVSKNDVAVQGVPVFNYTNSGYSLNTIIDRELTVSPQSDQTIGYIREDAFSSIGNSVGIISGSGWNVRIQPDRTTESIGTLNDGDHVTVLQKTVKDSEGYYWYEIKYNSGSMTDANENEVSYYVNPTNFSKSSDSYFQFLKLSSVAGVNETEVNQKILDGKGILQGKALSFIEAGQKYDINEIYLISHALLETGNGTSDLANGRILVNGKAVYNMYGIGAKDSCPNTCGAQFAYDHGWFTPEAAIIGGANFVSTNYIQAGQDTLYKMRWHMTQDSSGTWWPIHQYATDVGWAVKQTSMFSDLYKSLNNYTLIYNVPKY